MPSSDLELFLINSQDSKLIGNPEIKFFKGVFKRFSLFSMELLNIIPKTSDNNLKFNEEKIIEFEIPYVVNTFNTNRNFNECNIEKISGGDLLKHIFFVFELPEIYSNTCTQFRWINRIGEYLIKDVKFKLGTQTNVETISSEWIHIWNELYLDQSKLDGYNRMIGNIPEITDPSSINNSIYPTAQKLNNNSSTFVPSIKSRKIIVPIPFWFTYLPGCEYPLCYPYCDSFRPIVQITMRPLKHLFTIVENDVRTRPSNNFNINQFIDQETFSIFNLLCIGSDLLQEKLFNIQTVVNSDPQSPEFRINIDFDSTLVSFLNIDNAKVTVRDNTGLDITHLIDVGIFNIKLEQNSLVIVLNEVDGTANISGGTSLKITGLTVESNLIKKNDNINIKANLEANVIYLSKDERKYFQNSQHEYIIKKNQKVEDFSDSNNFQRKDTFKFDVKLKNFSNNSSKIVWIFRRSDFENNNQWFNFTNWYESNKNPLLLSGSNFNIFDNNAVDFINETNFESLSNKFIFSKLNMYFNNSLVLNEIKAETFSLNNYYSYSKKIPENGIFTYSFDIKNDNRKWNPTRLINLSTINDFRMEFFCVPKDKSLDDTGNERQYSYNIMVFSESYNIIKFSNNQVNLLYL